jgi:hypothetical protein
MRDLDMSDVEGDAQRMRDGWTTFTTVNGVRHAVPPTGPCATCGKGHCRESHQGSFCGGYHCPNCDARSEVPFDCRCGAGRANHVLLIPCEVKECDCHLPSWNT